MEVAVRRFFSVPRGNSSRVVAASVAAALILGSVLVAAPAQAAMTDLTIDDVVYAFDDATMSATATYYEGSATTLAFPESFPGAYAPYTLTAIGANAFQFASLTSVTLPEGLLTIGAAAFQYASLTSVTLPEGLRTIGDSAFYGTILGASVAIPASVTSIGNYAFSGNNMTDVTFQEEGALASIGTGAFSYNEFTSISIPGSVTEIGNDAFDHNLFLTEVTLNEGLETLGNWVFAHANIPSVVIPSTVTSLGQGVFYNNTSLASVTFAGRAPTSWAAPGSSASLGESNALVVSYLAEWGFEIVGDGGFTHPTWKGHNTALYVAEVLDPTVTFELNGHGTAVNAQSVSAGDSAVRPDDPSESGWLFSGWYSDAEVLQVPFDFGTPVTADVTAYAKWTAVVDAPTDTPTDTPTDNPVAAALTLDLDLAIGDVVAGSTVTVSAVGLLAESAYTVVVRSTPVTIAFGSASLDGTVTGTGVMPAGMEAGAHTVTFSGTAADGSALSSVVYFTVGAGGIVTYLSSVEADAASAVTAAAAASLASTGFAGAPLGVAALLLLVAGAALVVRRRRVAA